jgi:hypothetical protein
VFARRLLLLAAALLLLTALAAGLAPSPRVDDPAPAARAALPADSTTVAAELSIDAGPDSRIDVRRGDVLQLEVSGDTLDSVLIERLDRIDAIEPTTPARFEFLADAPAGVYPIRLVDADRQIGAIEITG